MTRPPEDRESRSKQGQWWQRWGQWLWPRQTTTETAGEGNNCKAFVAKDKLSAEGGLSDTNIILGWLYTFRTLTISLPDHKFIAWMAAIQKMITLKRSTPKDPDTTIRKNGTRGIIPWIYHFLSCLQYLHYHSTKQRFITINKTCA